MQSAFAVYHPPIDLFEVASLMSLIEHVPHGRAPEATSITFNDGLTSNSPVR